MKTRIKVAREIKSLLKSNNINVTVKSGDYVGDYVGGYGDYVNVTILDDTDEVIVAELVKPYIRTEFDCLTDSTVYLTDINRYNSVQHINIE